MNLLNKPLHFLLRYISRIVNGGTDGQLLSRNVSLDDEVEWVTPSSLSGITDADAIHDNVAGEIAAVTDKPAPVAADKFIAEDSAAGDAKVSVQMGNIDHDALTNFVANEHIDWTAATQNLDTTGSGDFDDTLTVTLASNVYGVTVSNGGGAGLTATASQGYRNFVFESNVDAGGSILCGSGFTGRINFGSLDTQANAAALQFNATTDTLRLGTTYASGEVSIDGGTSNLGVHVDTSGNVGIKNSSPSAALDVTGNIVVSGTVDGINVSDALLNVVEDTTPQLGGNLDLNGFTFDDLEVSAAGVVVGQLESTDNSAVQLQFKTNSTNRRLLARDAGATAQSQLGFEDDEIRLTGASYATNVFATHNATGLRLGATTTNAFARGPRLKQADETVNNSTTYQNDDDIFFSVAANEVYYFELVFWSNANTSSGSTKIQWSLPAGATVNWNTGSNAIGGALTTSSRPLAATGSDRIDMARGWITTAGTAGTAQLQWAQTTAHASNSTIKKGSGLTLILKV